MASQRRKLTVYGYNREIENNFNIQIPDAIQSLILYYFKAIQLFYFDEKGIGPGTEVSDQNNCTLTKVDSSWCFSYGSWWIDPSKITIIKCRINMNHVSNSMVMGISSSKSDGIQSWTVGNDYEPNYTLCGSGRKYINGTSDGNWSTIFRTNDIVTIKIDNYILNIIVNNKISWKNQEIDKSHKYRFAVGMSRSGNSITLLSVENS